MSYAGLLIFVFTLFLVLGTRIVFASEKVLTVKEDIFVDKQGRHVILHGINLVCKDRNKNYIGDWNETDFSKLKEWGINCIRLGIIWDGLEPSPGNINFRYLAELDRFIELARENNIYVILDMHQDLYSHKFGADGAPEWAVIDDGKPHIHLGGIWSDAYFTSPAIKTSFDSFWDNKKAIDGIGLQDHYALCWKEIAKRYASNPTVIGYDIMNEPFIGSDIDKVWEVMVGKFLEKTKYSGSLDDLEEMWFNINNRFDLLKELSKLQVYKEVIDASEEIYKRFETEKLIPFYRKVSSAIREVDKESLLFLEPSVSSNIGIYSRIEKVDDLQVYAPHAYDIMTDTPFIENSDLARIAMIFERHKEVQQRLRIPILIGEWGGFGTNRGARNLALFIVKMIEEFQYNETYWDYFGYREIESSEYFEAIKRPYPMFIAGKLIHYRFDRKNNLFECRWKESLDGETIIYLHKIPPKGIRIIPAGKFFIEEIGNSKSGYLIIPTCRNNDRKVEISF